MTDRPLEWHEIFNDGDVGIEAANIFDGVLLSMTFSGVYVTRQFIPGYRVLPKQGDMDRAALVRR